MLPELLRVTEACARYGCCRATLYNLISDGLIASRRIPRVGRRIERASADAFFGLAPVEAAPVRRKIRRATGHTEQHASI